MEKITNVWQPGIKPEPSNPSPYKLNYPNSVTKRFPTINKQAKMIRKDNYEQKTFDCETRYYNNSNNLIKLVMRRI
jgi:hypothetical protein